MWNDDEDMIEAAAAGFPATFGLRAFPDEVFKIDRSASYVTRGRDGAPSVMLYTVIKSGGDWLDFAKGAPSELRAQIVHLK